MTELWERDQYQDLFGSEGFRDSSVRQQVRKDPEHGDVVGAGKKHSETPISRAADSFPSNSIS